MVPPRGPPARETLEVNSVVDVRRAASERALLALRRHGFDIHEVSKRLRTIYLGGGK